MARRVAALALFALLAAACNSGLPGTGKASVPSISPTVSAASPSPTAAATPDATVTPWPTVTPEVTPLIAGSPLPTGYQRVTSVESGYTIGLPATWVFVKSDGAETVADQVAALKASAPKLAALVDAETGLLGVAVKLVAFDKVSDTTGMNANLIITAPMPSTDMKTLASTYATQIKSVYKVSAVATKQLTLPAGPTIEFDYSMVSSGVTVKLVQYMVLAPDHAFIATFGATSASWSKYQATFLAVAKTLQEI